MIDSRYRLGIRPESQPEPSEPMMLNRPMRPMVQAPMSAPSPRSTQIGRQVHGDEGELEAAGEEAQHQQHVAAVAEGLDSAPACDDCGLTAAAAGADCGVASTSDSGSTSSIVPAKTKQRGLPGERFDQRMRERRIEELPERARRGAGAERECRASFPARACRARRSPSETSSRQDRSR